MRQIPRLFVRSKSIIALFFVAVLAWPGLASAEKKRVGIPRFEGQQEALIRKVVMQVVKGKGFELVRSREIDEAAKSAGISLDSNDSFQTLAKNMALSAIVTGEVGKKKAKLTVRNGADGSVAGDAAFAGANPKKLAVEVAKNFWRRLGSSIEHGKAPSGAKKPSKAAAPAAAEDNEDDKEAAAAAAGNDEEDKDKDKSEEKAAKSEEKSSSESNAEEEKPKKKRHNAEEESSGGGGGGLRYLDVAVGVHIFNRSLTYNEDISGALRPDKLTAPAPAFNLVWYPGAAGSTEGPLANIGLDANVEWGFGLKSGTSDGKSYPTTYHDYNVGLRYRFPFGEGGEFAISGTGGEHAFRLGSGTNAPRSDLVLPDTIYHYIRGGLFVRVPAGPASVFVGAGYRFVLSPGQIKDVYFKNLSVGGIDAQAGLGYHLTPTIEVRAGVDLRRYFYDFKVTADSMYKVGGAIDQYIAGTIMLAVTLDGEKK
ncbi:MAG TPA: hypothetical protein VH374_16170 [Polyangia bacterium]|jgi:hypothetical protein|nr:hypothetical protein [Polyangia bacterium]